MNFFFYSVKPQHGSDQGTSEILEIAQFERWKQTLDNSKDNISMLLCVINTECGMILCPTSVL